MVRTYRFNDGSIKIVAESVRGKICELYDEDFVKSIRCSALLELKPLMFMGARSQAAILTCEAGRDSERMELLTSSPSEIISAYKHAGLEAFVPVLVNRGRFLPLGWGGR